MCIQHSNIVILTGITRLKRCFEEYNLPLKLLDNNNIKIVSGDLEKEWFGLDQKDFCSLADSVSCIYHVGAHVHHILGYGALRCAYSVEVGFL